MSQVAHPPDAVLQAYSALLDHIFFRLRIGCRAISHDELHDLADAMHNISGIIAYYGSWVDDEKYRQIYLRPFDEKWGKAGFSLERFLQARLEEYANS